LEESFLETIKMVPSGVLILDNEKKEIKFVNDELNKMLENEDFLIDKNEGINKDFIVPPFPRWP
jgi:c-di-AMP phosphodiesterase-like protein